ncbi:MAG TPA: copper-translocating P-type ATPase [Geobacter sp.]|nr:copper-translocating P-type ATPase [Geobacter sp.]
MEAAASNRRAERSSCSHCGLPVAAPFPAAGPAGSPDAANAEIFCCHACRMVAAIIGRHERGEHRWNLLRLGLGALLAMNVMMISLLLYSGSVDPPSVRIFRLVLLALSAPALLILVPPFLAGALREFAAGRTGLDLLIALGSLSAFSLSAVNALRGSGEVYFDTATMLPVLVTVGKIIEASAKSRAAGLLHALETLLPQTALLVAPEASREVRLESLTPGDLIRVRPGERVAVDGTIVEGESSIEEAAFTGEFLPRSRRPGDGVIAGTVNGAGALLVRAERTGRQLLLHGIVEMVQDAWANPSRGERIAQQAASIFLPAVLIVAVDAAVYWSMFGGSEKALLSALSVLVVACPCTIGIATPLATSLAIARAARSGIVVRGGSVMEGMARTDTVFFDKTGTLTQGLPTVQAIRPADPDVGEAELLGRLAALESASGHPLARGVLEKARQDGVPIGEAHDVEVSSSGGISGTVTWRGATKRVSAGTPSFVGADVATAETGGSCSVIEVAWDGKLRGRVLLSDTVRPDAPRCTEGLLKLGIASVLLSGDRFPAAAAVARRVGMDRVEAPRTPGQKLQAIAQARAAGRKVAMVGDGVNDAPALAAADTGMALGSGMELARQAGNVVILSGSLASIPWLIELARRTCGIIRGNFAWSFAYNAVALAAAAAGVLHPLLAALSMVVSSLTVLGNSLRIAAFAGEPVERPSGTPSPPRPSLPLG